MGYSGGTKENPSYRSLGDHSEAIQIDFDPAVISYGELLEIFWSSHNPTSRSWSRQYRSAIFVHDEGQMRSAETSRAEEEKARGRKIVTEIAPLGRFYAAEDYHQKHTLRRFPEVVSELQPLFPTPEELRDSTLAARLNGFLSGYGTEEEIDSELKALGTPPSLRERIMGILGAP